MGKNNSHPIELWSAKGQKDSKLVASCLQVVDGLSSFNIAKVTYSLQFKNDNTHSEKVGLVSVVK